MPAHRIVSVRQLELLVGHLEENRNFAVGRLSNNGPLEKRQALRHWEELATTLNAVGVGTTKTGPKWRDYWNEKKYAVRKKSSDLMQHSTGTGGGPVKKGALTPIDERICALLGKVAVQGNACVQIAVNRTTPPAQTSQNQMPPTSIAPLSPSLPEASESYWSNDSLASLVQPDSNPAPPSLPLPSTPAVSTPAAAPLPSTAAAADPSSAEPSLLPPTPLAPTPRRSYRPHVAEVPQWALQMEQKRQATQEQLINKLDTMANTMAATLCSIKRIEELLEAALPNLCVSHQL